MRRSVPRLSNVLSVNDLGVTIFLSSTDEQERWASLLRTLGAAVRKEQKNYVCSVGQHSTISLVSNPFFSSTRNAVGLPHFSSIVNVSSSSASKSASPSASPLPSLFHACMKNVPHVSPRFGSHGELPSLAPSQSSHALLTHIVEIVVPTPLHARDAIEDDLVLGLNASAVPQRPSIYQCGASSYIRLAPTARPQIVIAVDCTETAATMLRERHVMFERIGQTANSSGQLKLRSSAASFGELDIRLSGARGPPLPYFCEGDEGVLEGTIQHVQNPRVLGGEGAALGAVQAKDCWMEVRAMLSERPRI